MTSIEKCEKQFINGYLKWPKEKGYHPNGTKVKNELALEGIPTIFSSTSSIKMLELESVRALREIGRTINIILT